MFRYIFGVGCLLAGTAQLFAADKFPVGDWYVESHAGPTRLLALEHYKSDGTFLVEFRECLTRETRDHIESGNWTQSGNLLNTITESVWNRSVYYTGQFKVLSNNGHVWIEETVGGDALREFGPATVRKVSVTRDSKMPGCDITS